MIQKILLSALSALIVAFFFTSAIRHGAEADFMMARAAVLLGRPDWAIPPFSRVKNDDAAPEALRHKASVALGATRTIVGQYSEAVDELSSGLSRTETGDEDPGTRSARQYDLGNALAKRSRSFTGETERGWLAAALSAYTGSYAIDKNDDARANYEAVAEYLKRITPPLPAKPSENQTADDHTPSGSGAENSSSGTENPPSPNPEASGNGKGAESAEGRKGWTNAGTPRQLGGESGNRDGEGLSDAERQDLERARQDLSELQRDRSRYVRPDGEEKRGSGIPGSLRDVFSNDPFFQDLFPSSGGDGRKTW